jgi:DNA polymerase
MKNLHNALLLKQLYQLRRLGFNYTDIKPFSYQESQPLTLPNTIDELSIKAQNCCLCSLSNSRNSVLFGEGNRQAEIMIIGDIPLKMEDKLGRIFLGKGGDMLTAMIEKVLKKERKEVYLTNLLKCRPFSTEDLNETHFHTCKAYLFKEIEIIKPKVIITLGEKSYHYLTNNNSHSIEQIRKSTITINGYTIVPTYHPNFLLKNPSFKREVFLDLKRAKELLVAN